MEEQLKNILKAHSSYESLSASERLQLSEWCADEQEFQAMKRLFQQVDVWTEKKDDESNTKQRLDQLFAFQYAGKKSTDGPSTARSKQGFLSLQIWGSITAVAAALVLTWYFYPTSPQVQLTKNETKKKEPIETRAQEDRTPTTNAENQEVVNIQQNMVEQEDALNQHAMTPVEFGKISSDDVAMDAKSGIGAEGISTVSNGYSSTLSAVGATSYSWNAESLTDVQVSSMKNGFISKDVANGRKEKDAFSSFSLKSMPEMLDVLVASY
jgi:hypothetical protein